MGALKEVAVSQMPVEYDEIPRAPRRSTVCAAATLVELNGETKPALVWAQERELKWQTVKMRRLRGDSWEQALKPGLRANSYMKCWSMG